MTVRVLKDGPDSVLLDAKRLGSRFAAYREASEEARYDARRKVSMLWTRQLPAVLRRLRDADVPVSLEDDVLADLERVTTEAWHEHQQVRERIKAVDAECRRRGSGLRPYQVIGARWLAASPQALLADAMGTGKSLQTLAALPADARVLVVCPATVKSAWRQEVARWRPNFTFSVLSGRKSFRWPEAGEVVVTNYDVLPETHTDGCLADRKSKVKTPLPGQHLPACDIGRRTDPFAGTAMRRPESVCRGCLTRRMKGMECRGCAEILRSCPPNLYVVLDELHKVKDPSSQRGRRTFSICERARDLGGHTWGLTGTPLLNRPQELWALLKVLGLAQAVFGTWKNVVRLFHGKPIAVPGGLGHTYEWGDDPETEEIAARLKLHMLRRVKEDVLSELPPKVYRTVEVEVDRKALHACDSLLEEMTEQGLDVDGLVKALESKKALEFKHMTSTRLALATAKIPALLEVIEQLEEAEEPALVFSAHRSPVDTVAKRKGWAKLTGSESAAQRAKVINDFQEGKLKGVALTIQAGGTGITLTRASTVVFCDRLWTPGENEQAEDRAHRLGQRSSVSIVDLVAKHPLDQRLYEVLTRKQEMVAQSVDAAKADVRPDVSRSTSEAWHTLEDRVLGERREVSRRVAEAAERRREVATRAASSQEESEALQALESVLRFGECTPYGLSEQDVKTARSLTLQHHRFRRLTGPQWGLVLHTARRLRQAGLQVEVTEVTPS